MGPFSKNAHSLVRFEYISMGSYITWVHWFKITSYVSSIACCKICWRMESMVILGWKVYHHKANLVISCSRCIDNSLSSRPLFALCLLFITKKKLIHSVVISFHTIYWRSFWIDLPYAHNFSITWWYKSFFISLVSNNTGTFLKFSREKLIPSAELIQIFYFNTQFHHVCAF